jgi:GntR family transcriptional regulator/MocR family aminotransferase
MPPAQTANIDEARWWSLERQSGETLRSALERTLRDAILSGAMREGVRLPASRRLAEELGVSRGVVTDAYDQLASQGFLITRGRSAPVIAAIVRIALPAPIPPTPAPPPRYDLTPTTPDVSLFPLRRWLTTALRAGQRAPSRALDYPDGAGEWALREALADHLGATRGVIAEPEQIVITQGTSQAIELLLGVLRDRGASTIAVEDPSHTRQQARIRAAGLTLVAQSTDDDGLRVEGMAADAVIVTPAHQFPEGSVLSGERRRHLLNWSRATQAYIVEDDYDAEFRYDREPVRALQGLAPDRVVQVGTVSKTLAPALRLGWLVAPPDLLDDLIRRKCLADEGSPTLDQLTLTAFLRSGEYHRHVRRARTVYRARRDRLVQALAESLPELEVTGIAAGVHVLLALPDGIDDAAIAEQAARQRIRVSSLSQFCIHRSDIRGLVIGYGRLHESAVSPAVQALAAIVAQHLEPPR